MRIATKDNIAMYYVGFEGAIFPAETLRWPSKAHCTHV